jgi:cytidylate kinase
MSGMRFRNVTVSGEICSGKSSAGRELAAQLGWRFQSVGQMFRDYCRERGLDVLASSHLPDEVHREYDDYVRTMMVEHSGIVFEGRLTGWIARDISQILKVYLDAPLDVRVKRCIGREKANPAQVANELRARDAADLAKFNGLYALGDYRDPQFYDLTLDTSELPIDGVVTRLLAELRAD